MLKVLHNFRLATVLLDGRFPAGLVHVTPTVIAGRFLSGHPSKAEPRRRGLSGHSRALPVWHTNTTRFGSSCARGFKCQGENSSELGFVVFCE